MRHLKFVASVLAIFSALSWIPAMATLEMGVFPRRPVAVTHKFFKPLADYLSKQMGEEVKLVVPKNFGAFWKMVEAKQFDVVHYNQYHYLKSHKDFGYKVIVANEELGSKVIAGAITVRTDSGINSVEDLKGKTILFGGGKKAMGSYIATTAILKKHGLEAGKDYTVKFAKNPPSAVIGVYNKAADAAGSGNIILKVAGVTKKIDISKMKILEESEPFTHLTWAVKDSVTDDKAKKLQALMTELAASDEGKQILKSAKVSNFYSASDADYAKVREIVKFAIGEDY
jgi:phosphonate transport system substrate-binding protein